MSNTNQQKIIRGVESLGVILTVDLVLRMILAMLRAFNTWLLPTAGVPFVSLGDVLMIAMHAPMVLICVILEIGGLCYCLTCLLALLMIGITAVMHGWSWTNFIKHLKTSWQNQNWQTCLITVAGGAPVALIFSLAFRTPLLTSLHLPEVLLDYGSRNLWTVMATVAVLVLCLVTLLTYWRYWGLINLHGVPARQALFQVRHPNHQPSGRQFIRPLFLAVVTSWLINCGLGLVQQWWGPHQPMLSVVCLMMAKVAASLLLSDVIVKWVVLLGGPTDTVDRIPEHGRWLFGWSIVALLMLILGSGLQSRRYFQPSQLKAPATISHKGVADHDGVQNTIQALQRTSRRYHPDYVEMDIHETKDHQFVVMHDDNLRRLTGVNRRPGQMTLHQLTQLDAREKGQRARVVSFDDYLAHAKRLHQKLIVELKATRDDSVNMVNLFNHRYGSLIVHRHYLVHSLDYRVVRKLQRLNPQMHILYLQAYNFTNPLPTMDGFNNEYSSLNQHFIDAAHYRNQPVYSWTVNRQGAMRQLVNDRVDGIVTDRLPELQHTINQTVKQQSYVKRYWNYLNPVPNFP